MVAHTDCQPVACAIAKRRAHAVALRPLIRRRWALTALKSNAEVRFIAARRIMLGDVPDLASPDLGPEGDALYHSATLGG